MGYRDDVEALRARVEQLERENAALRRDNEALRRPPVPRESAAGRVLLGGPLVAMADRTVDGELPVSAHEAVLELLRETGGTLGEAQIVGGTLAWRAGPPHWLEVLVSAREGRTRVRVGERLGGLAGALFGGIVGGAGGGGIGVILPLAMLVDPGIALAAAPLWVASTYALARGIFARRSRAREVEIATLTGALAGLIEREIARAEGPRVRIEETREEPHGEESSEEFRGVAASRRAHTSKA